MAYESTASGAGARPVSTPAQMAVWAAGVIGCGAALTAFIDGVVLMAKRTVIACPDGTFFPLGTKDFTCHAHPRMAEGLAMSALSLSVGVLVVLLAYLAVATLSRAGSTRP